jgi:sensor histidine kinase YesM
MAQLLYWLLAALVLFMVFSNKKNDLGIRMMVVAVLTTMNFLLTQLINRYFIPKFFFEGRLFLFFYLLLFAFVVSIWVNTLCIVGILWHVASNTLGGGLPNKTDLVLLLSGSYIIILFATIVHFVQESYRRTMERDRISRLKTETELRLNEARLKLLQGQLHPHFLFNMLNNLYGLWIEKSGSTPEVILKLSALLDYMLYRCDKDKVPLNEEIRFIRNYIELETIRHDTRLKLEIELHDQAEELLISPLLLFSFVENAFKHGANKTSGESWIKIRLTFKDGQLRFEVENNFDASVNPSENNGIGLKNVKERLMLLYPEKHRIDIGNENGIFKVTLSIEIE